MGSILTSVVVLSFTTLVVRLPVGQTVVDIDEYEEKGDASGNPDDYRNARWRGTHGSSLELR